MSCPAPYPCALFYPILLHFSLFHHYTVWSCSVLHSFVLDCALLPCPIPFPSVRTVLSGCVLQWPVLSCYDLHKLHFLHLSVLFQPILPCLLLSIPVLLFAVMCSPVLSTPVLQSSVPEKSVPSCCVDFFPDLFCPIMSCMCCPSPAFSISSQEHYIAI